MPVSRIQRVVFQKALETTGSVSHLALILNVSVRDRERWIAGNERAPTSVFTAALDLIQDIDQPPSTVDGARKPGP